MPTRSPITPSRAAATLLLTGALLVSGCSPDRSAPSPGHTPSPGSSDDQNSASGHATPIGPESEADTESADSVTVVNKRRPLAPQDYVPSPLVPIEGHELREDAAGALTEMLSDMRADGVTVSITSAYRSYDTQIGTYEHWVRQNGQGAADQLSARPGYSEHQTGLAVDLADGNGCDLQPCFAQTPAGQWGAENAFKYGFVVRFPSGAEAITGYRYEPWHVRYIGRDQAQDLHDSRATTMEQYYGTGAAPSYG